MAKQNTKKSFLGVCPVCRKKLQTENSNIINKSNFTNLYCVECKSCFSSVMLAVFSTKDGIITTMGILTDIQKKDTKLIQDSDKVIADDALTLYNYINSNNNSKSKKYEITSKNKRNSRVKG